MAAGCADSFYAQSPLRLERCFVSALSANEPQKRSDVGGLIAAASFYHISLRQIPGLLVHRALFVFCTKQKQR